MKKSHGSGLITSIVAIALTGVLTWWPAHPAAAQDGPPAAEYASDAILIQFASTADSEALDAVEASTGGEIVKEFSLVPGLMYMRLPVGADVMKTVDLIEGIDGVDYAEPDYIVHPADTIPNDTRWPEEWALSALRAPTAWDTSTGSPNVVVAVIDTGVDTNHPDLVNNLWTNPGEIADNGIDDDANGYIDDIHGWDFYDNDNTPTDGGGHGTHNAGIICAEGNNGQGVAGVTWRCKIMVLRFMGPNGGFSSAVVDALGYLVAKQVKLSNNSWGGDGYSVSLYNAINNAKAVDHLFVAAAGNSNSDNDAVAFYPSSYNLDNIIAVAATTEANTKASFSNWGVTRVDLAAPGVSILSTVPNAGYAMLSGTSMATPQVAGALSLLYGMHPGWTYQQARDTLFATVQHRDAMPGLTVTGGILDLAAALWVGGAVPQDPSDLVGFAPAVNRIELTWSDVATNETGYTVERSMDSVTWDSIASLPGGATTAVDTGCQVPECRYRVRAYNEAGASGYSNVVTVTPILPKSSHVGDLDGTAMLVQSKQWGATVTIYVEDQHNHPLPFATVSGVWSTGNKVFSCQTTASGQCSITKTGLKLNVGNVSFRVTGVRDATHPYQPSYNHDPDGDSTGTVIVIPRP